MTDLYAAVDHTYLKTLAQNVSLEDQVLQVKQCVQQAVAHGAYSVCLQPHMVPVVTKYCQSVDLQDLKLSVVTGFPSIETIGLQGSLAQVQSLRDSVDEFDMVMDYRQLLTGNLQAVKEHILRVSDAVGEKTLKVIFENAYLSENLIKIACEILNQVFIDLDLAKVTRMAKTSTGFASPAECENVGAVIEDVQWMRAELNQHIGIKVAGGIKDLKHAWEFFEACGAPTDGVQVQTSLFRIGASALLPTLKNSSQIKELAY